MQVIKPDSNRLPIKSWCSDIESGALAQVTNLANLPFAFRHIALMPDCHQGYGMPIGGVLATKDVIIPNAVGVDIGCGMCAVKTSIKDIDNETLKELMGGIRKVIPVGFNKHKEPQDNDFILPGEYGPVISQEEKNIDYQIGTLGGGNHFIEIQKDIDGYVFIMIHSGSRNLGFKVAKFYNDIAIELNKKWHSSVPIKHELSFLPMDSYEGKSYINDMEICVDFAYSNRMFMLNRIMSLIDNMIPNCMYKEPINVAHNYASLENHFNKNVWVHRKGAISARKGEFGIIPGSQGTCSYIVRGLGNKESFMSCSHGAGRKMGRKQAQRTLNLEYEQKKLNDLGVIHSVRNTKDLDEAPGSYKNIDEVMENQEDLVEVIEKLTPLGVIKG